MPTKQQLINDLVAMTGKFIAQGKQFKPNYLDVLYDRVFHWFPNDGLPVAMELREKLITAYPDFMKQFN